MGLILLYYLDLERHSPMLFLIIFLACVFAALGAGVLGAWSDFQGLKISNIYTVVVLITFCVAYASIWLSGADHVFFPILSHLLAAVIVFGVTAVMFSFGALGAADSKLGTAFALWVGIPGLPIFLFWMALMGGVLGVAALVFKKLKPITAPKENSWIAQVQGGQSKVPYGIAIAFGGIVSFAIVGYLNVNNLSLLLMP